MTTLMGRVPITPQCHSAHNLGVNPAQVVAANPGQCCHLGVAYSYLTWAEHQNGYGRSDEPDRTRPLDIAILGIEG
jgi:hypothetical protein